MAPLLGPWLWKKWGPGKDEKPTQNKEQLINDLEEITNNQANKKTQTNGLRRQMDLDFRFFDKWNLYQTSDVDDKLASEKPSSRLNYQS